MNIYDLNKSPSAESEAVKRKRLEYEIERARRDTIDNKLAEFERRLTALEEAVREDLGEIPLLVDRED